MAVRDWTEMALHNSYAARSWGTRGSWALGGGDPGAAEHVHKTIDQTKTTFGASTLLADGAPGGGRWAGEIRGRLSMARNAAKHRSLDISMEYSAVLEDGTRVAHASVYPMSVLSSGTE